MITKRQTSPSIFTNARCRGLLWTARVADGFSFASVIAHQMDTADTCEAGMNGPADGTQNSFCFVIVV